MNRRYLKKGSLRGLGMNIIMHRHGSCHDSCPQACMQIRLRHCSLLQVQCHAGRMRPGFVQLSGATNSTNCRRMSTACKTWICPTVRCNHFYKTMCRRMFTPGHQWSLSGGLEQRFNKNCKWQGL